jgi:asparagine synthase (glutamine-hydrolysing)
MSGITGILDLNGRPVDRTTLADMAQTVAHRGPDGGGLWFKSSVGLTHQMLHTTAESLDEELPFHDSLRNLVITADARLDNRTELLTQLDLADTPPAGRADSRLILNAYAKWGERCPEFLEGDFSFAIWDAAKQTLFCARDHIGIKPFYYFHQPRGIFVFASELKAILSVPAVPHRLNRPRIGDLLASELDDQSVTLYEDIFRLPPGHCLSVQPDHKSIRPYWRLELSSELKLGSDQEYAEAFLEVFRRAVSHRLRSALPIGSTLSGGMDSSSVTCLARDLLLQENRPDMMTFSLVFEHDPEADERPFIDAVLAQGHLQPHFVPTDRLSPLIDHQKLFSYFDELFVGPNAYYPWLLNKYAHQQNTRVLLFGLDGDSVVSHGFYHFAELAMRGEWATVAEQAQALAARYGGSDIDMLKRYTLSPLENLARTWQWWAFSRQVKQITSHFDISARHLWWYHGVKPVVPGAIYKLWWKIRKHDEMLYRSASIINPAFARETDLAIRHQSRNQAPLTQREEHWQKLTAGGLTYILELNDLTSARFAIEPRYPFLDRRVIEFCLSLPPRQKLDQGWTRRVLHQAMTGILPEKVRQRSLKAGVGRNFVRTILAYDRAILEDVINTHPEAITPYVQLETVQEAYRRLVAGQHVTGRDTMIVWKAVNLGLWLRHTGY